MATATVKPRSGAGRVRRAAAGAVLAVSGAVVVAAAQGTPAAAAPPALCAAAGSSGAGDTLTGVVDTYYPGTASAVAGSTTISVGAPSGAATVIASGDLLLVIQMQGADIDATNTASYGDGGAGDPASGYVNNSNLIAGDYEYVRAASAVAAGSVTIVGTGSGNGLVNSYASAAASATSGARHFQVVRVPQYTSATFGPGLTASAWNGTTGGILAVDVTGTLTLNGTVSVDGLGFRGGVTRQSGTGSGANTDYVTSTTNLANGRKAEGLAGTSTGDGYPNGDFGRGAPGNAGGGGTDGHPSANDQNSGGGGGGNGGAGGVGGNTWNTNLALGGFGGTAFVQRAASRIVLGGGGGAGTSNNSASPGAGGAAGGGIVFLRAGRVGGTGTISANGAAAYNDTANDGGGGGGAGGSIVVLAAQGSLAGLTANADGGRGGDAWRTQPTASYPGERHGPGGGGGGGVVITSSAVGSTSVAGGGHGTTTTANDGYGSTLGSPGVVATASPTAPTGAAMGSNCVDVALTKTHSGQFTVGVDGTYTLTVATTAAGTVPAPIVVTDTLPTGLSLLSAIGGGFTCSSSGQVVTCTRSTDLAPASSAVISLSVAVGVSSAANVVNTASVQIDADQNGATADDSASDPTTVNRVDLRLIKSHAGSFVEGTNGTYTLQLTNLGTGATFGDIVVTDTLPAGLGLVSATGTGFTCSSSGQIVTCTRLAAAALAAGASVAITVTVAVQPSVVASIVNQASVTTAGDVNAANDTASDPTTVSTINDPPIAQPDAVTTLEDTAVTVTAATLLVNDSDVDGDAISVLTTGGTTPGGGSYGCAASGCTYTPAPDFNGADSFPYSISDGTNVVSSTVTVTVTSVNDPVIAVDESYTTNEDTPVVAAAPGVLGNDSYNDGLGSIAMTSAPAHGTVIVSSDGSFTYTPSANYYGPDSFVYLLCDADSDCGSATVSVTILSVDEAVAVTDDSYFVMENAALTMAAPGVLGNDSAPDGFASVAITTLPVHGTVTVNDDGSFVYTPVAYYNGADGFSYSACDVDGDCGPATVSIVVDSVDDPVSAADNSYTTDEDTALVVPAAGVLTDDSFVDGFGSLDVVGAPAHGTVSLSTTGAFIYVPAANFAGADLFDYELCDTDGDCVVATVTIDVTPLDDPVIATGDAYTTDEDVALSVVVPGVLGNDQVADGLGSLTVVTAAANGTLTVASDGSFVYTPAANYYGLDQFTYSVCDVDGDCDIATVALVVNSIDDPVVATADAYIAFEHTPLVVAQPGVLANDGYDDGFGSISVTTGPANGSVTLAVDGSFTYVPAGVYSGPDQFVYTLCDADGDCADAVVAVTVTPVDDPVVATDEAYGAAKNADLVVAAPGVLDGDSYLDGVGSLSVTSPPVHGSITLSVDGSFVYTPDTDYAGLEQFTYTLCDTDDDCDSATVTIDVGAIDSPVTAGDDAYILVEDSPLTVPAPGVRANDSTQDGFASLTITSAPAHGTLMPAAGGSFTYLPTAEYQGSDSFAYSLCDVDGDCAAATVTLTVTSIDDPVIANDDAFAVAHDSTLVVAAPGALANDAAPDGLATVIIVAAPLNGTAVMLADGSFTYTPVAGFAGADRIDYELCDTDGDCAVAHVRLTVAAAPPVNHPPVVVQGPGDTFLGGTLQPIVPLDPDGNGTTVEPTGGVLPPGTTLNADGTFAGAATTPGSYTFTVRVCDDQTPAACTPATFTVNVLTTGATPSTTSSLDETPTAARMDITDMTDMTETPTEEEPTAGESTPLRRLPNTGDPLPGTGSNSTMLMLFAIALLASGSTLIIVSRRRQVA